MDCFGRFNTSAERSERIVDGFFYRARHPGLARPLPKCVTKAFFERGEYFYEVLLPRYSRTHFPAVLPFPVFYDRGRKRRRGEQQRG